MPVTDKIKNNLFIWGNNTTTGSDLASLAYTTENPFIGTSSDVPAGGGLVEAGIINSGIRLGSLAAYSIIEALKKGPAALNVIPASATVYNDDWFTGLADNLQFNYDDVNANIDTFATNLHTVVNQYLKYSSVYAAVRANVWNTPRTFTVKDNSEEHSQANSGIDGSADVTLKLPSTIKADILGSATEVTDKIGNQLISDIFVYDGNDEQTAEVYQSFQSERVYTKNNTITNGSHYLLFTSLSSNGYSNVLKNSSLIYNPAYQTLSNTTFKAPNFNGNYTTCSQAGDTKTATLTGFVLETGARIFVKFTSTHSGGNTPTLNVNSTGAKTLKWGNSSNSLSAFCKPNSGDIFELLYDGTYWVILVPNHILGAEWTKETLTITKNGSEYEFDGSSATNLSFYAPNTSGENNQVLISQGSGNSPIWTSQCNVGAGKLLNIYNEGYTQGNSYRPIYFNNGYPYLCTWSYRAGTVSLTGSDSNNIGEAGSQSSSSWNTWGNWFHGTFIKIGRVLRVSLRTTTSPGEDRWIRVNLNWVAQQCLGDTNHTAMTSETSCQITAYRTSAAGLGNVYAGNIATSTINNKSVVCCFISRDEAGGGTGNGFGLDLNIYLNQD